VTLRWLKRAPRMRGYPWSQARHIRDYAKILANLAQNYLAGIKDADPAQQSLLNDSDVAFGQIRELCK
jgi:hypothetical protein